MMTAFQHFDKDGSGFITEEELVQVWTSRGHYFQWQHVAKPTCDMQGGRVFATAGSPHAGLTKRRGCKGSWAWQVLEALVPYPPHSSTRYCTTCLLSRHCVTTTCPRSKSRSC